jgi:hypothetical protein
MSPECQRALRVWVFGRHPSTTPTCVDVPEKSRSLPAVGLWQLAALSSESTRLKVTMLPSSFGT